MAAPQFKAVLIATPQMRSESGLTFRSKQSAVWPADHVVDAAAASQQERLAIAQIPHNAPTRSASGRRSTLMWRKRSKANRPLCRFRLLGTPARADLGQNQYVELEIKKAKVNGTASKLPAVQKPCEKMAEAIVMDGGKRGQTVEVCADPDCRVHHCDTPTSQQVEGWPRISGCRRQDQCGCPIFAFFARAGTIPSSF
jgi:hypothetical protein